MRQHIFTSLNVIRLLVKMLCNEACAGFPAALRVKWSYAVMRTGADGRAVLPMGSCGMLATVWIKGLKWAMFWTH